MEQKQVSDYMIVCYSCGCQRNLYELAEGRCFVCGADQTDGKKRLMKVLLAEDVFFDCDESGTVLIPEDEQLNADALPLDLLLDDFEDEENEDEWDDDWDDDDADDLVEDWKLDDRDDDDWNDDDDEDSCDWEDEDDIALEMEETIDDAIMFRGGNPFDWDTRSDYLDDPFGFGDHDDGDDYDD